MIATQGAAGTTGHTLEQCSISCAQTRTGSTPDVRLMHAELFGTEHVRSTDGAMYTWSPPSVSSTAGQLRMTAPVNSEASSDMQPSNAVWYADICAAMLQSVQSWQADTPVQETFQWTSHAWIHVRDVTRYDAA